MRKFLNFWTCLIFGAAVGTAAVAIADNITISQGAGTTLATDTVSGVNYQRQKIALGADGAFDMDWDSGRQTAANSAAVVQSGDATTRLYANYAESSITASFTTAASNSSQVKIITLKNKTNQALEYSFDGTNVWGYLDPGESDTWDLAAAGLYMSSNVSVRYVSNPTSGSFIVEGLI